MTIGMNQCNLASFSPDCRLSILSLTFPPRSFQLWLLSGMQIQLLVRVLGFFLEVWDIPFIHSSINQKKTIMLLSNRSEIVSFFPFLCFILTCRPVFSVPCHRLKYFVVPAFVFIFRTARNLNILFLCRAPRVNLTEFIMCT